MFFALSAYLLTTLLLREKEQRGTIDVRKFYMRRILRIWPLYFFVISLALLASRFDPTEKMDLFHVFLFAVFLGRVAMAYYGPIPTFAAPLWSVSVEEQFYLVWPWVVRRSTRFIVWLSCLTLFICFVARFFIEFGGLPAHSLFRAWFWRIDPIVYGALLAILLKGNSPRLKIGNGIFSSQLVLFHLRRSGVGRRCEQPQTGRTIGLSSASSYWLHRDTRCMHRDQRPDHWPLFALAHSGLSGTDLVWPLCIPRFGAWLMSRRATAWLQLRLGRLHHGQLWFVISFEVVAFM